MVYVIIFVPPKMESHFYARERPHGAQYLQIYMKRESDREKEVYILVSMLTQGAGQHHFRYNCRHYFCYILQNLNVSFRHFFLIKK